MKNKKSDSEFQNKDSGLLKDTKKRNRLLIIGIVCAAVILVAVVCILVFPSDSEDEQILREYESHMGKTYATTEEGGVKYIIIENESSTERKSLQDAKKELEAWKEIKASGDVDLAGRDPENEEPASESETETTSSSEEKESSAKETEKSSEEATPDKTYKPGEITFEEYMALSAKEQDAYALACKNDPNYGLKKFVDWYNAELKKYNSTTEAPTTLHPGDVIDLSPKN